MKKVPKLTDEENIKIHKDYSARFNGNPRDLDFQIELALDHDAAKKAGNSGSWNLYVRNWLNRANTNGNRPAAQPKAKDPSLEGL